MLMHGKTRDQIEKELGTEMQVSVNEVAQIARKAIFEALQPRMKEEAVVANLHTIEVDNYAHMLMTLYTNMGSGPLKDEIPNLEKFAIPEVSLIYSETSGSQAE
ncbi:hypothetical protein [Pseudophaeobacter sp. 1A09344]|uniref:hypothetical protein n=1 Tax=Pseudophaeobacter sp. 1A09344 TaxID=3098144 RepID=UPI0034D5BEF0